MWSVECDFKDLEIVLLLFTNLFLVLFVKRSLEFVNFFLQHKNLLSEMGFFWTY